MFEPTFCRDCDNVTAPTRKLSPRLWTCIKFPRLENMNPIAPTEWMAAEPYNLCRNINLGYCPCFVKRRDGQKELPVGMAPEAKPSERNERT